MKKISVHKLETDFKSRVLNSGKWVDGPQIEKLETVLKKYLGIKYVTLTNNGTSALLAAYWALKDKFKTLTIDPYTFPASYLPAKLLGYEIKFRRTTLVKNPNFSDHSLNTIVHLYGQPNPLLDKTGNKFFIEDACQAFGAEYKGKKLGTLGSIGCFSFYPTKSLHTCGHGGAVVTNDKKLYQKMKVFIESGRVNGKVTENLALNLRMDEIKAEFLLKELAVYEKRLKSQLNFAKELIQVVSSPQPFLSEAKSDRHIYSVFNLLVKNRDRLIALMNKKGIETMIYYGKEILPKNQRNKYKDLTGSIVALPCRWNLTAAEKNRIISALKQWFL